MAVETGITQFHDSVCSTTVEVLWLSKKPWFYCLLYFCVHGEAPTFVCLFHWSEPMIVTEGHVWTVGGMWKNFPHRNCCSFSRVVLPGLGLALLWRRTKPGDSMLGLSAFIAHFKCFRVSSHRSALTLMPLGKQSIRRGLRRSKNIVSITLPTPGMVRLCFGRGDKKCFLCWLTHFLFGSYHKQQDSSPLTTRFKTTSPYLSCRGRFSQKIPTRVAFCSSFKPFGTSPVAISLYPRTCVTMWCARFMLMPRCSLTRRSVTWRSHFTVLSTLAHVWVQRVGWKTGACQFLSAASYPLWTSCTSRTLLYAAASSRQREHASFENECPRVLQLPHTETGCRSFGRACTNP